MTLKREGLGRIVVGALLVAGSVLGDAWLIPEAIAAAGGPVALTVARRRRNAASE